MNELERWGGAFLLAAAILCLGNLGNWLIKLLT